MGGSPELPGAWIGQQIRRDDAVAGGGGQGFQAAIFPDADGEIAALGGWAEVGAEGEADDAGGGLEGGFRVARAGVGAEEDEIGAGRDSQRDALSLSVDLA